MDAAARDLASGRRGPRILLFEHPPVITLGIRARAASVLISPDELARRGILIYRVGRGGDATWHGPGQLVGYPVVDLRALCLSVPAFVLALETALVRWLQAAGLAGEIRKGLPGVWTGDRKVASVGVRVSRGMTAHGFALNLRGPMEGHEAIVPCGLAGVRLTTVEAETGRDIAPSDAARGVAAAVGEALGMRAVWHETADSEC
jgi:lipoate-protein ligase B